MAYASYGPFFSRKAGQDFTDKQYHAVTINAEGELILAGAGEFAVGVLTDDRDGTSTDMQSGGEHATYQYRDIAKVVSGGEISYGDMVMVDEDGKAVAATGGNYILGIAQEESSGADYIISVQLHMMHLPA